MIGRLVKQALLTVLFYYSKLKLWDVEHSQELKYTRIFSFCSILERFFDESTPSKIVQGTVTIKKSFSN